jgi:hypothetical protein
MRLLGERQTRLFPLPPSGVMGPGRGLTFPEESSALDSRIGMEPNFTKLIAASNRCGIGIETDGRRRRWPWGPSTG